MRVLWSVKYDPERKNPYKVCLYVNGVDEEFDFYGLTGKRIGGAGSYTTRFRKEKKAIRVAKARAQFIVDVELAKKTVASGHIYG